MDFVEAEGNSIDEAIERALELLGVDRASAEIDILSNVSRGVFGIGGKKAKVRATRRKALDARDEAVPAVSETNAPVQTKHDSGSGDTGRKAREEGPPASPETLARAGDLLREMIRRMGMEVQVEVAESGATPRLAIAGDASGLLIGRRGQTLDAIEYIINRAVARDEDGAGRITVDSENYRARRRQSLEEMALKMAARACERGAPVTMNLLSPRDRRIIHLTLQGNPTVTTRSSGEGHYRELVIIPQGAGRGGGRARTGRARG